MDYQTKLKQLYRRKNNITAVPFSDSADFLTQDSLRENKALKYICKAMEEVEDNYRKNTIEAAKKVGKHLEGLDCEFRLQGSFTTKTEIKQSSDIDLVVITNKACNIEQGLINNSPYRGNLTEDLKQLRLQCEHKLKTIYQTVCTDGAKSIEVHLTNPNRKVDVVVANWYKTHDYHNSYNSGEYLKGIYLYDKKKDTKIGPDFPFLRSYNINHHSSSSKIKKIVRFLKNLREDFEIQNLTSFQINCIAYNLPYDYYPNNEEINWLRELQNYLPNQGHYKNVNSPCGKEEVRINHNSKLAQVLNQLIDDASEISYENTVF